VLAPPGCFFKGGWCFGGAAYWKPGCLRLYRFACNVIAALGAPVNLGNVRGASRC
jgi:hypothetical protein